MKFQIGDKVRFQEYDDELEIIEEIRGNGDILGRNCHNGRLEPVAAPPSEYTLIERKRPNTWKGKER